MKYLRIPHFCLQLLDFMIHFCFPLKAFNLIHILMLCYSKKLRKDSNQRASNVTSIRYKIGARVHFNKPYA